MPDSSFFFRGLLFESPMLVVWGGGLIASVVFMSRAPLPALLTLFACLLGLLQSVGGNWVFYSLAAKNEISLQDIDTINIMRSIVSAMAWAIVILAALAWRKRETPMTASVYQPPQRPPSQQPPTQHDIPPESFRR